MTFTSFSDGDVPAASVFNANWVHNRGMGNNLLPMDGSGSPENNTRDIGSGTYKWKDLYLAGDANIDGEITVPSVNLTSQPMCQLYKSSQGLGDNTESSITFSSEEFDTNGFHSTSSNTDRITIPTGLGGKYMISAAGLFNDGNQDILSIHKMRIRLNGATTGTIIRESQYRGNNGFEFRVNMAIPLFYYDLDDDDYITVSFIGNTTSGTLNALEVTFNCMRIGD